MSNRTVKIEFDPEDLEVDEVEFYKVLGYLSQWSFEYYPYVTIYQTGRTDFAAIYKKEETDTQPGFVIGAIWSEADQKYSTHS